MTSSAPRGGRVPIWRVLRLLPLRGRIRLLRQLRGGRRDFVVLGDVPVAGTPQTVGPARPGTVVFRPNFSLEWPLSAAGEDGGTSQRALLPLPEELKGRVDDWAARWNQAMHDHFYEWPDEELRAAFDHEARTLCAEMQAALGPHWHVEYGGVDA